MDERTLTQAFRQAVGVARTQAERDGERAVEAEHLLAALAADPDRPAGAVLAALGLTPERLAEARDRQRRTALESVGMHSPERGVLQATVRRRTPQWGTSAKEALLAAHRHAAAGGRRRGHELDLLVGIVQAPLGTAARILAVAGVDRGDLLERAESALGAATR